MENIFHIAALAVLVWDISEAKEKHELAYKYCICFGSAYAIYTLTSLIFQ